MSAAGEDPTALGVRANPATDPFLEARIHSPPRRDDWVPRDRLVAQVERAVLQPVVLVAAPAGYGKTTCLAQWLGGEDRPATAWVSLDGSDDDPSRLWTLIGAALARAELLLPTHERGLRTGGSADAPGLLLQDVLHALAVSTEDVVLVLDDFHVIQDPRCHAQVEFLVDHLPAQAHLVIITRADPGLRLGRLRASGGLAEIRADDLGFTREEAALLLASEGVHLSPDPLASLVERTEGWPAGLYLATVSLTGRDDPDEFVRTFSGGNRFVGDYLTEEVLGRHGPDVRAFITTVSFLDRFSASLCDHVAGTADAASLLRDLERSNLFLVPLDERGTWFRFHRLFAAVARSELEMTRPTELPTLHARAADWFRVRGHVDETVTHALAAGDRDLASEQVRTHWLSYVDAGRAATVMEWLRALLQRSPEIDPGLRVTAAWMAAVAGDERALAEHLTVLEESAVVGPLADGSHSGESAACMIRGLFGYGGPVEMLRCSRRAVMLETDTHSPFHAIANVALGHASYLVGDLDGALPRLRTASRSPAAPDTIRALGLSVEALVDSERGELDRSRARAEEAMELVESLGLGADPQVSLAYLALGQAQAAVGKLDDAMATLERGLAARRDTPAHGPWGLNHHLLGTAQVACYAGEPALASELLSDLELRLSTHSDGMEVVRTRVAAVRRLLDAGTTASEYGDRLTGRELDVLRLLQGSLSLQQIAGELSLSFNTVKTHARALYRKLDAHSRAGAVRVGRERQLI